MYVCKAFYQQFEWAAAKHWRSVSKHPVLVCQGADDKVTPIAGAENLVKLLQQQLDSSTSDIPDSRPALDITEKSGDPQKEKMSENFSPRYCSRRIRLAVIEKAGHCLQEEKPAEIIAHMEDFFSTTCDLCIPSSISV